MGLQLDAREVDRVIVVEAAGRLTLTDGHTKLRDLIHVHTGDGAKKFVLNLARLEFVDSYGIGELARSYSVVRRAGGDIKASVSRRVLEILEISRLTTVFEIHPEESAALKSFRQRA
jgi:anti-sigma B factor antagonist